MAYCVQADLERAAGGLDKLVALTDNDADGSVDTAVMDAAIEEAEGFVNGYSMKRWAAYDVTPKVIRRVCADLAVYFLIRDRRAVSDREKERYDDNVEWLRDLARGRTTPGIDPAPAKSDYVRAATGTREDSTTARTRKSMEDFA